MFCFCFLAYGEEHINEFNIVAKSILKLNTNFKIIVGTDSPTDIINGVYDIIQINEGFNYNLKRVVIEHAFKEFDTILFLDTDIFIKTGVDFSILDELNDGMYAAEIVGLDTLKDVYGSLEYMREYLDELTKIYSNEFFLIHEGIFVLELKNNKQKEDFIKYWIDIEFLQDNFSYSKKNVFRGMHLQINNPQGKFITCLCGKILDIVLDCNPKSKY